MFCFAVHICTQCVPLINATGPPLSLRHADVRLMFHCQIVLTWVHDIKFSFIPEGIRYPSLKQDLAFPATAVLASQTLPMFSIPGSGGVTSEWNKP